MPTRPRLTPTPTPAFALDDKPACAVEDAAGEVVDEELEDVVMVEDVERAGEAAVAAMVGEEAVADADGDVDVDVTANI